MKNRELLELAAKAAGYPLNGLASAAIVQGVGPDDYLRLNEHGGHSVWNPLTDDGDALRLAVNLGIGIDHTSARSWAFHAYKDVRAQELHGADVAAATRRAIVRAAAEIALQSKSS